VAQIVPDLENKRNFNRNGVEVNGKPLEKEKQGFNEPLLFFYWLGVSGLVQPDTLTVV